MTKQDAIIYFKNYENYCNLYGERLVNSVICDVDIKAFQKFANLKVDSKKNEEYATKGYKFVCSYFKDVEEHCGDWTRTVDVKMNRWLVPNDEASIEYDISKKCILLYAPYLAEFNFMVFKYEKKNFRVYIDCKPNPNHMYEPATFPTLYVPVKAILTKNKQLVRDDMIKYFTKRYEPDNVKKYLHAHLALLESAEAKRLFEIFKAK